MKLKTKYYLHATHRLVMNDNLGTRKEERKT
jgi:hypothetical protein